MQYDFPDLYLAFWAFKRRVCLFTLASIFYDTYCSTPCASLIYMLAVWALNVVSVLLLCTCLVPTMVWVSSVRKLSWVSWIFACNIGSTVPPLYLPSCTFRTHRHPFFHMGFCILPPQISYPSRWPSLRLSAL